METKNGIDYIGLENSVDNYVTKVVNIGGWDMSATNVRSVAHGLSVTEYTTIKDVKTIVYNDASSEGLELSNNWVASNDMVKAGMQNGLERQPPTLIPLISGLVSSYEFEKTFRSNISVVTPPFYNNVGVNFSGGGFTPVIGASGSSNLTFSANLAYAVGVKAVRIGTWYCGQRNPLQPIGYPLMRATLKLMNYSTGVVIANLQSVVVNMPRIVVDGGYEVVIFYFNNTYNLSSWTSTDPIGYAVTIDAGNGIGYSYPQYANPVLSGTDLTDMLIRVADYQNLNNYFVEISEKNKITQAQSMMSFNNAFIYIRAMNFQPSGWSNTGINRGYVTFSYIPD